MVQTSTLLLAAFAIAPVLAAPLGAVQADAEESFVRSVDPLDSSLEIREPAPFGRFFKKIGHFARRFAPHVFKVARLLIRDEDGTLYVRDVELSKRDMEEIADLQARDPKFRLKFPKKFFNKALSFAGGAAKIAGGLLLRDVEDENGLELRAYNFDDSEFDARSEYDIDLSDLSERDLAEYAELAARDPKFRLRPFVDRFRGVARKALGVAGQVQNAASALGLREFDEDEVEARDYGDIDDLLERDLDLLLEDLDAREPFNIRRFARGARRFGSQAFGVVNRVSSAASAFGLRELEDELETRRINELD
jgi:hypothetical protein